MNTEEFSIFTISLLRRCENSFIAALDEAQVPHGRVEAFGHSTYASPVIEVISQPSQTMPWGIISAVIFTWLKQSNCRDVLIRGEDGLEVSAKDCNAVKLKEMLVKAVGISVMEIPPKRTSRPSRPDPSRHAWH